PPGPRSVSCWAPWRWARSCCCRRCTTCFACSRGVPDGSIEHPPRHPPSGEAARNEAQEHPPHTEQLVAERSDERCHDEVDEGLEQCHVAYRSAPMKCSDTYGSAPSTQLSCPGAMWNRSPGPSVNALPSSMTTRHRPETTSPTCSTRQLL